MPKITIFSLDYDGCADILFDDVINNSEYGHDRSAVIQARAKLEGLIHQLTKQSEQVELYVGSNRQSQTLNFMGTIQNDNGDCFKNYQDYCQKMNWKFRPLLYADTQNQQPAGSSINNHQLQCRMDSRKFHFLKNQIEEITKHHPSTEVDYYFLDDDHQNILMPWLQAQFIKENFASHIRIHLIKFHRNEVIEHNINQVNVTRITKKGLPTESITQCTRATMPLISQSVSENRHFFWKHSKKIAAASGVALATAATAAMVYRLLYQ